MSSCGSDHPTAVVVPFSEDAHDYLYHGGIGSVWEYSYKVTETDTNGATIVRNGVDLVRYTLLDTGVTRKGVEGLTVLLRQGFRLGVVDDTDTMYFSGSRDSIVWHRLPHSSVHGYNVLLKGPFNVGAKFLQNPDRTDQPNGTVPTEITHVGVTRTVKAGTFSTVECRRTVRTDGEPFGGAFDREETEQTAFAPENLFVWLTAIRRDTYPSGKVAQRLTSTELIRIERK